MTSKISGVVEQVNRTDGPGGPKPKWKKVSVKIKGAWYSGFINDKDSDDRTRVKEGDTVEVDYVENGRYFNIEKLVVTAQGSKETTKADSKGDTKVQEYIPSAIRDLRITVAGARNTAIEFVKLALETETITLKATKGKKVDELLEYVNYYTEVFAQQLLDAVEGNLIGKKPKAKAASEENEEYSE